MHAYKSATAGRLTQARLAELAGVHQSTVSRALKGDPALSVACREKVLSLARQHGFVPDPHLSGLSAYALKGRSGSYRGTLAWLTNYPEDYQWRSLHMLRGFYEGARTRAEELGYRLELYSLSSEGMSGSRMAQILRSRGIRGIVVAPQYRPGVRLDFSFRHFSVVTVGYTTAWPCLPVVAYHQYKSVQLALEQLRHLGYRRIGLAVDGNLDRRAGHAWSSAYWSEQSRWPSQHRLPLLTPPVLEAEILLSWYRAYRPEVILGLGRADYAWLMDAGVDVPSDVGLCRLAMPHLKRGFTGMLECPRVLGARAVELLFDQLNRHVFGVPTEPLSHLALGRWVPGRTVLPL